VATWAEGRGISLQNGAVCNNLPGAIFDVRNDVPISTFGSTTSFHNAGTFRKSAGTGTTTIQARFSNTGTVEVQTGTLNLAGLFTNFSAETGTLTDGTYQLVGTLQFNNADVRINSATLVLDGLAARLVDQNGTNALAHFTANTAAGSFMLDHGRDFTTATDFTNAGTVVLEATTSFTTNGVYTQVAGSTTLNNALLTAILVDIEDGILSASGTITADVQNAGQLDVGGAGAAGLLVITGNFTQTASGVLNLEIGGLEPDGQYDQLQIGGVATLDGTLNIALLDDYFPNVGDGFQVLTFGSREGDFAAINGLDLGGGVFFDPVYDDQGLTLVTRSGS
jgi:hypothetical protein